MNPVSYASLTYYWSSSSMQANAIIVLNLLGSFLLGIVVGYERSYRGRAAGMRTYGLVCMAATALTVIAGYPSFWYGGNTLPGNTDPTRVVQGIVTGIGFLGAGVIMKDGANIRGLTSAASIWASSVIGVMVGAGFYAAAILMALFSAGGMGLVHRLEAALPQRAVIAVVMRFRKGYHPREDVLQQVALARGYDIQMGTLSISSSEGCPEWRFSAEAQDKHRSVSIPALSAELQGFEGVESFSVSHSRN